MTKLTWSLALLAAVSLLSGCQAQDKGSASPSPAALQTEEQKTVYALGVLMGRNLSQLNLSAAELELVKKGLADAASGQKPQVELEAYGPKVQEFARSRAAVASQASAQAEKERSKAYVEGAAGESGAVKTASGLVYRPLKPGKGASPSAKDVVKVHYDGRLIDGTVFDSSVQRGQPAEFPVGGVIPCWTEGLQRMKVGERAKLVCPSEIAYGDQGRPPKIPAGATLVFEVELLEIKK